MIEQVAGTGQYTQYADGFRIGNKTCSDAFALAAGQCIRTGTPGVISRHLHRASWTWHLRVHGNVGQCVEDIGRVLRHHRHAKRRRQSNLATIGIGWHGKSLAVEAALVAARDYIYIVSQDTCLLHQIHIIFSGNEHSRNVV